MGQVGKINGRKRRSAVSEGMVEARTRSGVEARVRRGVVPGAEPEKCVVCGMPSEGWHVAEGKRTWYHFGRAFPCVERVAHIAATTGTGTAADGQ